MRFLLCLFLLCAYAPPATALDFWPFDDGIAYELVIDGLDEAMVEEHSLEDIVNEAIDPENPPENMAALNTVSGLMAQRLRAWLESDGYYDATVRAVVKKRPEDDPLVTLLAVTGERYHIIHASITHPDAASLHKPPPYEQGVLPHAGEPATAKRMLEAAEAMKSTMDEQRCFLSLDVTPKLVLDATDHSANVRFNVKHGAEADFGNVTFTGDSAVSEEVMRRYLGWKQGECFSQSAVDATQVTMLQSQLFAQADMQIADKPNAQGQVPVTIHVTDRPHRTITAGVNFATGEGVGVNAGWEHRNMYGEAHRLSTSARWSQLQTAIDGQYRIPYFYHDQQTLSISGALRQETTDTFDADNISALVAIERQLWDAWLVGVGGGVRFSRITEAGLQTENYGLVYVPVYTQWDTRNNLLDATRGLYARLSVSPYYDVTGQGVGFVRTDVVAQTYLTEDNWEWSPTLALRAAYGQINGASVENVPADLRFYSGGGGSVRGYGFRAIGEQRNGEPLGGTVWTELSAEIRLRFTDTIGAVAFMDAGAVYDGDVPDPAESLFLSAGVGARYYSPVGPIRFDVGVPLDDVPGDDTSFGIYASIGQAF